MLREHIPFVLQQKEILYMETSQSLVTDSKPPVSLVTLHHNKTKITEKKPSWIRILTFCSKTKVKWLKQYPHSLYQNINQTAIRSEAAKTVPNKQCLM